MSGTTSVTASVSFTGIRVTITYQSGPEITLTPSGGNVERGQTITATGPNVANLTYAAVQGDLIIPIEPKIIGPDEVLLEIPYPPTDPCFDCLGDCPQCDECFTACNEDLTGEACQECMEACLDCLVQCLENLELAEACHESTGTTTTPTIVVVVCGGPGFTGTVVLGSFTILTANGSGLYRFTLGKTNDTLYASTRDGETYDVKIPNPNAKTGFFRS